MSITITRIGETQAKPELTESLRDFLLSIMPIIKSSEGCESVTLYQSHDDATKFTMLEVWDSIESHQASVKNIPSETLTQIRPCSHPRQTGDIMIWLINRKSKYAHRYRWIISKSLLPSF